MDVGRIADWASIIGAVLSIVSIGLTIYLTKAALAVRQEFQRLVLLPTTIIKLSALCEELTPLLKASKSDAVQITRLVGTVQGTLVSLRRYVDKKGTRSVDAVLRCVAVYNDQRTKANLETLYQEMYRLLTELENEVRRMQWDR